jgi:hypothetical protein
MRRVVWRVAVTVAVTAAPAHAGPWTVTGEAGGEVDSNVQRVETGPGLMTKPIGAGVLRFGVRADRKDRAFGGAYVLGISDLTRVVGNPDVLVENVTVLAGDLRWLHQLGDRPVLVGAGVTAADALPLSDDVGARTFRNLGADALVVARAGDDHLTLAVGGRDFVYKPEPSHVYDWSGPTASGRLDLTLWQPPAKTKSLELAAAVGVEIRNYPSNSFALVNTCPTGAPPSPTCSSPTDILRRDRYSRAGVELTWVGDLVAAVGYQVGVIDSNSYGQSLVRHRVTASTTGAFGKTYATLLAILQIDQYIDGLIVQRDLQHTEFTNVEDENRSSLQLRVARKLSSTWSLEGRAAVWRNLAGGSAELAFHRELVYAGLMYSK